MIGFLLVALGATAWAYGAYEQQTFPSSDAILAWASGQSYTQPPNAFIIGGIAAVVIGVICVLAWLIILASKRDAR